MIPLGNLFNPKLIRLNIRYLKFEFAYRYLQKSVLYIYIYIYIVGVNKTFRRNNTILQ